MENYSNSQELKKHWKTTEGLFKKLAENGYTANYYTLRRWEIKGIIPKPKRVKVKNNLWRVYSLDGKDFDEILSILNKKSVRIISIKP